MEDTYDAPPHGWTCFHCGETFTTVGSARTHFGTRPDAEPGCMIRVGLGPERGLLMALRKAEDECFKAWEAVHSETTDVHKAMASMRSRHGDALRDAEELGYARGLKDARGTSWDITWLWTHCRAVGMVKKSDSGLALHDIALYVSEIKDKLMDSDRVLQQALEALKYHQEQTRPINRTAEAIDAARRYLGA